jgi:hypothetical protein
MLRTALFKNISIRGFHNMFPKLCIQVAERRKLLKSEQGLALWFSLKLALELKSETYKQFSIFSPIYVPFINHIAIGERDIQEDFTVESFECTNSTDTNN